MQKTCSTCGITFPATPEYFYKRGDKLRGQCKGCRNGYCPINKKNSVPEGYRRCSKCNQVYPSNTLFFNKRDSKTLKMWCKKCQNKHDKMWRHQSPGYMAAKSKEHYYANRESRVSRVQEYRENNREVRRQNESKRRKNDPCFRIRSNLRRRLHDAVSAQGVRKSVSTIRLIGCTIEELKEHLESQFTDGMSWENYGKWHIDHIVPCAVFDLIDIEQQELCFNYSNLQPLWAKDNLRKQDKLPHEWCSITG